MSELKKLGLAVSGFIVFIVLVASWPFATVAPGEVGVKIRMNEIVGTMTEGTHLIKPFIEDVTTVNVQTQLAEAVVASASKDLQTVSTKVGLNYSIKPTSVIQVLREYQNEGNVVDKVITPIIQDSVKAATAKYTAEELITKRESVRSDIQTILIERMKDAPVTVGSLNITNFDFSPEFNDAIERKVTAEQNALASKNKLEQVKYEAEQQVATARATAESIRLQSDAANNEKYVSLKQLEVQMEFAKKWNGVGCQSNCWGVNAQAPIPFLDINKR